MGLSTLVEKTAQYGRWPLEREMAEDRWQPSLHNFLPSHCQGILVTLKLYFIFLFLVSWTRTRMTNDQCFRFSLVQTEHKCDKAWMQLPQSSGGGWQVKALTDAVGTWLGGGRGLTGWGTVWRLNGCVCEEGNLLRFNVKICHDSCH